jgi:hypothetical protein
MTHHTPHNHDSSATPADLLGTERLLNELARAERATMPPGMLARVADRSAQALLTGEANPPELRLVGTPAEPAPRVLRLHWSLRVAAAVALVVGAGLVVMSYRGTGQVVAPSIASTATTTDVAAPSAIQTVNAETVVTSTLTTLALLDEGLLDSSFDEALSEAERLAGAIAGEPESIRELTSPGSL